MYYFPSLLVCALLLMCKVSAQNNDLQIPNKMPSMESESAPSPKPTVTTRELAEGHVLLQVIDAFLKAIKQGALSQAYYAFASEEFRKETSYKDFKIFADRFASIGRNATFTLLGIDHYEDKAAVTGNVRSLDHIENTVVFDMVFESGRWRILGIQIYSKQVETE